LEIENWKLKIVQLKHLVRAVSPINDILAIFELKKIMEGVGLFKVKYYNLFNGIAAVHVGVKV